MLADPCGSPRDAIDSLRREAYDRFAKKRSDHAEPNGMRKTSQQKSRIEGGEESPAVLIRDSAAERSPRCHLASDADNMLGGREASVQHFDDTRDDIDIDEDTLQREQGLAMLSAESSSNSATDRSTPLDNSGTSNCCPSIVATYCSVTEAEEVLTEKGFEPTSLKKGITKAVEQSSSCGFVRVAKSEPAALAERKGEISPSRSKAVAAVDSDVVGGDKCPSKGRPCKTTRPKSDGKTKVEYEDTGGYAITGNKKPACPIEQQEPPPPLPPPPSFPESNQSGAGYLDPSNPHVTIRYYCYIADLGLH